MNSFNLNIISIKNYDSYENKAKQAAALFIKVFNLPLFRGMVNTFTWNGQNQFANNAGLTNNQIFEKLIAGTSLTSPVANNIADIKLEVYAQLWWPFGPAIGYSDTENGIIYTKRHFVNSATLPQLAGHYAHEYCHLLGFEHDFNATDQRQFSVPYGIGDIVETMAS